MNQKWAIALAALLAAALALTGCGSSAAAPSADAPPGEASPAEVSEDASPEEPTAAEATDASETEAETGEEVTILVAAAASLQYSYTDRLIPMFQEKYPNIKVEGTYDSSGKLQTQIEEGLEADVFMSAAMKQMNALKDAELADADSIVELLENRIVLIAGADADTAIASFEEIGQAETIAIGDPESVPAGQYAKEALEALGLYKELTPKFSLGSNVTEVLHWVAESSADVGIVYATDAATTEQVKVLAEAPEGSLAQKVIYPVGIVSASEKKAAAALFVEFLQTPEAIAVFEEYGFTSNR